MIELVFTVCLITTPEHCVEKRLSSAAPASIRACLMSAQPRLARWNAAHPKWRVGRWFCRSARLAPRDA